MRLVSAFFTFLAAVSVSAIAHADQPYPWQIWHQAAGSQMMRDIEWFDFYTLWFIIPITIFVLALLIIVGVKFKAKSNPKPSRVTHNLAIEANCVLRAMVLDW